MRLFHKIGFPLFLLTCMTSLLMVSRPEEVSAAKQTIQPTNTQPSTNNAYITVTYIEPINVRSGPASFDYPVIGSLPVGGTAAAIGKSPAGEWIQIVFPAGPEGVGWVYSANVTLSANALLPVVEAPATQVPDITPNPTFEAALQPEPTTTRKPTFTAPPPLNIPTYASNGTAAGKFQIGWIIVGLALVGLLGTAISSLRRR